MRRFIGLVLIINLTFLINSCDVSETFIRDKEDGDLPAYTEVGNDIMGANINEFSFRSSVDCNFYGCDYGMRIYQYAIDTTLVSFYGMFKEGPQRGSYATIDFFLCNVGVSGKYYFENIVNRNLILSDSTHWAEIEYYGAETCIKSTNGFLRFNKVAKTSNPNSEDWNYLMAGVFEFAISSDTCEQTLVMDGRFDFDRINSY